MRLLLLILCLLPLELYSQVLEPTLISINSMGGGDVDGISSRIIQTDDGGFILNLSSNSSNGNINTSCISNTFRFVYKKMNKDGVTLEWEKCSTDFQFLLPLSNGNNSFFGYTRQGNDSIVFQLEDANGNILNRQSYGGSRNDFLRDVIATPDGGFVVLCESYSDDGSVGFHYGSLFEKDLWVFKIDINGNIVWNKVIGGSIDERGYSIHIDAAANIYIVAATNSADYDASGAISNPGIGDVFISKINQAGSLLWSKCYGGTKSDGYYVSATTDNQYGLYIATGSQSDNGNVLNAKGLNDFWVFHIDSSGAIKWSNCFGGSNNEIPRSICKSGDGTLWVAGGSTAPNQHVTKSFGREDAWIINISEGGTLLSAKVLGGPREDACDAIFCLPNNLLFFAGRYVEPGPVDGEFPSMYLGGGDIFYGILAPWTTGIEQESLEHQVIQLYPNPATSSVYINNPFNYYNAFLITDVAGKRLSAGNLVQTNSIDIHSWPAGVYRIICTDKQGNQKSIPFYKR